LIVSQTDKIRSNQGKQIFGFFHYRIKSQIPAYPNYKKQESHLKIVKTLTNWSAFMNTAKVVKSLVIAILFTMGLSQMAMAQSKNASNGACVVRDIVANPQVDSNGNPVATKTDGDYTSSSNVGDCSSTTNNNTNNLNPVLNPVLNTDVKTGAFNTTGVGVESTNFTGSKTGPVTNTITGDSNQYRTIVRNGAGYASLSENGRGSVKRRAAFCELEFDTEANAVSDGIGGSIDAGIIGIGGSRRTENFNEFQRKQFGNARAESNKVAIRLAASLNNTLPETKRHVVAIDAILNSEGDPELDKKTQAILPIIRQMEIGYTPCATPQPTIIPHSGYGFYNQFQIPFGWKPPVEETDG
jgi:hypothetical protein